MALLLYLFSWFFKAKFFGRKQPLQTVLFISEKCNLACRHCNIYRKENPKIKTYEQVREELEYAYGLGSRFVDFEGGEPMLWEDGEKNINDLIRLAKQIGFFSTTVTTNAQLPFKGCEADSIWVSLDGLGKYHDEIRGKGTFERLVKNIAECGHAAVSVNMVVNRLNHPSVVETIEFVRDNPHIKSISFNFHTPFPGTEELFVNWGVRGEVVNELIRMKKAGYPIMNSVSGLRLMAHNKFRKQCWVTNFILPDGTRLAECTGKTAGVCDRCGFCMAGEMRSVFDFKFDTIRAGMNLRVK